MVHGKQCINNSINVALELAVKAVLPMSSPSDISLCFGPSKMERRVGRQLPVPPGVVAPLIGSALAAVEEKQVTRGSISETPCGCLGPLKADASHA